MKWLIIIFLSMKSAFVRARIIFFTPIVISACYNRDTVRFWASERILASTGTGTYFFKLSLPKYCLWKDVVSSTV